MSDNPFIPQEDCKTIELGARVNVFRGALQMMIDDPEMPEYGRNAAATILQLDSCAHIPPNLVGEMKDKLTTIVAQIIGLKNTVESIRPTLETVEGAALAESVIEVCENIEKEMDV